MKCAEHEFEVGDKFALPVGVVASSRATIAGALRRYQQAVEGRRSGVAWFVSGCG